MWAALRNRAIGWGFKSWAWSVRVRRSIRDWGRSRIGALDHITIPVKDLALARKFYCDILGAAYLMTVDDATLKRFGRPPAADGGEGTYHISVYTSGRTRVDLFLQHSGQPSPVAGHPHFAFRVSPMDMLTWQRVLQAKGIPTDGPLQLGPPGQASLYFNDPFGNHLELTCFGFPRKLPIRPPSTARLAWAPELIG